jgi:hypothetical protein
MGLHIQASPTKSFWRARENKRKIKLPKGEYIRGNSRNMAGGNIKTQLMVALPLSILAFAAGVYLLIKVKREYIGSLFTVLAWFVIVASLASITVSSIELIDDCCEDERECHMDRKIIIREGKEGGGYHHMRDGGCMLEGCKMEGDSCVMEKEACEKMMGKDACDSISKLRGRCIMSKEECMEMCHGMKEEGKCGAHHGGGGMEKKGGCCMGKGPEGKKACSK